MDAGLGPSAAADKPLARRSSSIPRGCIALRFNFAE
jgi:hypothetical protein